MPTKPKYPGVYVSEVPSGVKTIEGVSSSTVIFLGRAKSGTMNKSILCRNLSEFSENFTMNSSLSEMPEQVKLFFMNGGEKCYVIRIGDDDTPLKVEDYVNAFEIIDNEVDIFNLLVLPRDKVNDLRIKIWDIASTFCKKKRALLIIDAPDWKNVQEAVDNINSLRIGLVKDHSAIFYPRLIISVNGINEPVGPCGAIAGLMARIDKTRGLWKAPAGIEADIRGVKGLEYKCSDKENDVLNQRAINTLRIFPNGIVNWGARTMDGDDNFQSEYRYIPVRRLALYIEESLYRGLKWVAFEPNDEPLWAQIRLHVEAFLHNLFRQGAFQGTTPKQTYFVKCDKETTTQNDINQGIVNILVGFAPLKPAEFIMIYIQQMAGQIEE